MLRITIITFFVLLLLTAITAFLSTTDRLTGYVERPIEGEIVY